MVNNPQALIATLKAQHRTIQEDLRQLLQGFSSQNSLDGGVVLAGLSKLKNDVLGHLELENGVFYPDYLAKKSANGQDITQTEEFIKVMDNIGKEFLAFLEKYNNTNTIENSKTDLFKELNDITATINTRIETEEEGVFDLYLVS